LGDGEVDAYALAESGLALVVDGAGEPVAAWPLPGLVDAARRLVARVIGAGVPVVADEPLLCPDTDAPLAVLLAVAQVVVRAGSPVRLVGVMADLAYAHVHPARVRLIAVRVGFAVAGVRGVVAALYRVAEIGCAVALVIAVYHRTADAGSAAAVVGV